MDGTVVELNHVGEIQEFKLVGVLDIEAAVSDNEVVRHRPTCDVRPQCLDSLIEGIDALLQFESHQQVDDLDGIAAGHRPDSGQQLTVTPGQHQPVKVSATDLLAEDGHGIAGPVEVMEQSFIGGAHPAAPEVEGVVVDTTQVAEQVLPVDTGAGADEHIRTVPCRYWLAG